ncbi:MAG: ferritin-like domain-containing protein [Chloroflexota bacterium]|nr:ferritin-like domain-containing protein [Chloroflexota bacterium]
MSNKRTIKALEELVKTEYMAVGALDAVLENVSDKRLSKQYRKFRDQHGKQADALNDRLEDLGGERLDYEVGSGKGQAGLWGKLTSARDDTSVEGMRVGAERGIKRYIDHIDDIDDPKALSVIRKNLEAKQDEMGWYDEQSSKERADTFDTKIESTKSKVKEEASKDGGKDGKKKKRGLPFPLLLLAGAAGAVFFLLRRNDDSDFDDYGEDAFSYEGEESGVGSSYDSSESSGASSSASSSEYNADTSHGSNGG